MRNLIVYFFLLTHTLFGVFVEPSLIIREYTSISQSNLNFNLSKNSGLKLDEAFISALLTPDNKYIIALTYDNFSQKNRIIIFDKQTREIVNTINDINRRITTLSIHNKFLLVGKINGNIEQWSLDNILDNKFGKPDKTEIFYTVEGVIRRIYSDNQYVLIDYYHNIYDDNASRKVVLNDNDNFYEGVINNNPNLKNKHLEFSFNQKKNRLYYRGIDSSLDILFLDGNIYYKNDTGEIKKTNLRDESSLESGIFYEILSKNREEINYNFNNKYTKLITNNYLITSTEKSFSLLFYTHNRVKKLYREANTISIKSVSISTDSKYLLTVSDYEIKLYDIFNHLSIASYQVTPIITDILFTKNDKYMITSTNTGYIHIWDMNSSQPIKIIKAHTKKISSIDINDDDRYLVTGSEDDYIRIWDIQDINNIKKYDEYEARRDILYLFFYQGGVKYQEAIYRKSDGELIKPKVKDFKIQHTNKNDYDIYKFYNSYYVKIDNELREKRKEYKATLISRSLDKKYIFYERRRNKIVLADLENDRSITLEKNYSIKKISLQVSNNNRFFVVSDENGNILIYNRDGKLSKVFKSRDDGSWIAIDKDKMKIKRGEILSRLWFKEKNSACLVYDDNKIEVSFPKEIDIVEGITNKIKVKMTNKTDEALYTIKVFLENKNFILKPNNLKKLKANQSIEHEISLINDNSSQVNQEELKFKVKIDGCEVVNNYNTTAFFKKPNLSINRITINSDRDRRVYYQNIGSKKLKLSGYFDDNEVRDIDSLDANSSEEKTTLNTKKKENEIIQGLFLNENPPFQIWDFNKTIIYQETKSSIAPLPKKNNFIIPAIILIVFISLIIWIYHRHNRINNPSYLLKISPHNLKRHRNYYFRLFLVSTAILNKLNITKEQLDFVVEFLDDNINKNNIFFKEKLQGSIIKEKKGAYLITLPKDFPLNIERFYVMIKEFNSSKELNEFRHEIENIREANHITVIFSKNKRYQKEIIEYNNMIKEKFEKGSIPYNKIITPTSNEIMKFLLSEKYDKALIELFVKYITPKHISPFESKFSKYKYFDQKKEKIVHDLSSKDLNNLFILGGNNSGKSYLLKRIKVNLEKKSGKYKVKWINKNNYDQVYNFVLNEVKYQGENSLIFLVDDVDSFLSDKDTNKIFRYFKELSDKENIFFVMTGFWRLYQEIYLKENSYLKRFDQFKIEKISDNLDTKLARTMIVNNMGILNIKFNPENIVDDIIYQSGGKLDLINLICHQLLKEINYDTKVIEKENFENVLKSKKVADYIEGLNNFDDPLERIIIYGMKDKESFSLNTLSSFLHDCAIEVSGKEIENYLKKLTLYNVFEEKENRFIYKNLLFKQNLRQKNNTQQLLEMEIKNYNSFLPIVKKILDNPLELYEYSYLKLHTIYKQLQNTKSIDTVINKLKIEKKSFEIVKDAFSKKNQNFYNAIRLFSEKIDSSPIKENNYYLIKVSNDFPLGIQEFIIHFSTEKDYKVIKSLFNGYRIVILITTKSIEAQNNLYENTLDKTDRFIAPKSDEITKLFLNPSNESILSLLSDIFSRHLSLDYISPYQPNSSIDNASMFFGREKIIATVTQREPKNYLIVGARRVGKSSLLKAMQRKLQDNRNIESFYCTLSHTDLKRKIIDEVLELDDISTFDELKHFFKNQDKKYLFFIDEVDDFIKEDRRNNYSVLKILREMSEEKYAFFVLTGFWQLYQSRWEEYKSPLLNFGETKEIGELETEACRDLIQKPMKSMHISFENEELVEEIIVRLGQKAQLISLACHLLVDTVSKSSHKDCITNDDIKIALNHPEMRKELGKFPKIDGDRIEKFRIELQKIKWSMSSQKNNVLKDYRYYYDIFMAESKNDILRKVIIYSMLNKDSFTLEDIQVFLKNNGIVLNYKDVEFNLEILVLTFFLKEENYRYSFRIPKQKELFLADNIRLKLEEDIEKFKMK